MPRHGRVSIVSGFTSVSVAVVRRTGVLLLGLSSIAGRLAGGVVLDLVASGPDGRLAAVLGAAVTLVAVGFAAAGQVEPGTTKPVS